MEHQHSQQAIAKSLDLEDAKIKAPVRKELANSYFLHKLIQRHPLLVLLGVSTFLFFSIYSSVVSIFQIGVLKEASSVALPSTTSSTSTKTNNSLLWWLLGAVAVGGGSVAVAKRLSTSKTQFSPQSQSFPQPRQSILSLSALKLSEPKPTWADSLESQVKIHSETDESVILVEDPDSGEDFLKPLELTAEEQQLKFDDLTEVVMAKSLESPTSKIASAKVEDNLDSPANISLVEMLDIRKKLSLATLLEINN